MTTFAAKRSPPTCEHCQVWSGSSAVSATATGQPRPAQHGSRRPCVQTRKVGASVGVPCGAPGSRSQSSSSASKVPHHVASEPGRASAIAHLRDSVGRCALRMRRSRAFAAWHRARRPASTDVSSRDSRRAFRPQAPGCSTRTKRSAGAAVANSSSPRRSAAGAQRSGTAAMPRCYGRDGSGGRLRKPTGRPRRGRGAAARGPRPTRADPGARRRATALRRAGR